MARLFQKRPLSVPFGKEVFTALLGGSEGGLATTAAIITGLFVSTNDRELVLITAVITFMVQAFNGAVSRFSGERINDEIEQIEKLSGYRPLIIDAVVQLASHIASAAVVAAPIVFIVDVQLALVTSVTLTLILLFLMGFVKGRVVKNDAIHDGLEMVILGALIISVGVISGWALRQ